MSEEHTCIVVPVVLRPDPTTPDTACFGVIVTCAETGFCGFRLAQGDEEAIARIVGFFPPAEIRTQELRAGAGLGGA